MNAPLCDPDAQILAGHGKGETGGADAADDIIIVVGIMDPVAARRVLERRTREIDVLLRQRRAGLNQRLLEIRAVEEREAWRAGERGRAERIWGARPGNMAIARDLDRIVEAAARVVVDSVGED